MAWIELHQTLPTNRKTMRLKRLLRVKTPQAVGHMCMLWLWAVDNAADGDLTPFAADEIAEAAGYAGKDPEAFVQALVDAGFVDADADGGMMIHEWGDYVGELMDKRAVQRAQARERAKKFRDKRNALQNEQSNAEITRRNALRVTPRNAGSNAEITQRNAPTVQYSTEPNTVPVKERKDKERNPAVQAETGMAPTDAGWLAEKEESGNRMDACERGNRKITQADMPEGMALELLPEGMMIDELPMIRLWRSKGREVRTGTVLVAIAAYLRDSAQAGAGEARAER